MFVSRGGGGRSPTRRSHRNAARYVSFIIRSPTKNLCSAPFDAKQRRTRLYLVALQPAPLRRNPFLVGSCCGGITYDTTGYHRLQIDWCVWLGASVVDCAPQFCEVCCIHWSRAPLGQMPPSSKTLQSRYVCCVFVCRAVGDCPNLSSQGPDRSM